MGQSNADKLNKLVELNYIKKAGTKDLFEKLEYDAGHNSYSYILFLNEYKKEFNHFPSPWNNVFWDNSKITPQEQTEYNNKLVEYLEKLFSNELISENQYRNQIVQINNKRYFHKIQLLEDLASQQNYEEWINPEKVLQYAEQLLKNGLIADTSYQSIRSEIETGRFKDHSDLYKYLKNAKYFDLAQYSDNPEIYLEQIHKAVASILPELEFSDFNYEIVTDSNWSDEDYVSRNVIVTIKANGKIYKQKSFIALDNFIEKGTYLGKIDDQEFYKIFNKILADNQSPLRLHRFGSGWPAYGDNIPNRYFGIIALLKSQADMFRYANSYIAVSYENFKNRLTTSTTDKAIQEFENLGLFAHLSEEQISQAKEKVKEQDNQNRNDVLAAFPEVIYYFDTELTNIDNPYEELIREYGIITHGDFRPEDISDDFNIEKGEIATLTFKFNNKNYSKQFKIKGDWIDSDFFKFTKSISAENNLKGQFYELYTDGQGIGIIYLTPKQYEYIRANKLLIFGDEWQTEEE